MTVPVRSAWQSTAITVLTTYSSIVIAGAAGILAARVLGAEGRGQLAAIQTWPIVLGTIASLGLPEALVYFSAKNPRQAGAYAGTATAIAIVSTTCAAAIGYVLLPSVLSGQTSEVLSVARRYLLVTILFSGGVSFHVLRGLQRFGIWNILRLLPSVAWLGVVVAAWASGGATATSLAYAAIVTAAIVVVPFTVAAVRNVSWPPWPERKLAAPLLRVGMPNVLAVLPQTLNLRLDQMLMIMLFPPRTIGLYVVAVSWSSLTPPVITAVGTVMSPKIAAEESGRERSSYLAIGTRLAVLLASIMIPLMMLLTPVVLPFLFGPEFRASVPAALILVVASGISAVNRVLQDNLRGCGRPSASLWAEVSGLAFTLLLLLILLRPFELLGAAVASLLAYSTVLVVLVQLARSGQHVRARDLLVPRAQDLRLLVGGAKGLLHRLAPRRPID